MKISDRSLRINDSLKISDFSNSLGCCSSPKDPQQYAYGCVCCHRMCTHHETCGELCFLIRVTDKNLRKLYKFHKQYRLHTVCIK